MKKFFSFTLAIFLMISVIGLVGCNGLWDFEDDDDAVAAPIAFSMPAAITLANVDNTLLAATVAGTAGDYSKLVANVYMKSAVAATADTLVTTTPLTVTASGALTIAFSGYAGNYYVKVTNPNNANFVLYLYFDGLAANLTTTQAITEATTAAGLAIQAAKKAGRVAAVADITAANLALMTTTVTTALTTAGTNVNTLVDDAGFIAATIVNVTGVTLNKSTLALVAAGTETLVATIAPTNATTQTVTWASSDATVASVDATGKVLAVKAGTATITVTTTDGSMTATCVVTVTAAPVVTVAVTGVTVSPTTASVAVGATTTLTATIAPTTATNQTVTWTTSDATVATVVSTTGVVTGVKAGTATITATTADGSKTSSSVVTVTVPTVAPITLNATVTTLTTTSGQIKLTGMSTADEATLEADTTFKVTLPAGGTNYDFTVDKTISGLLAGTVILKVNTTTLATFDSFNAITFSAALPTGTVVSITKDGTEIAKPL